MATSTLCASLILRQIKTPRNVIDCPGKARTSAGEAQHDLTASSQNRRALASVYPIESVSLISL